MNRALWFAGLAIVLVACDNSTGVDVDAPSNLTYQLEASGDPDEPAGLILQWDGIDAANLREYRVYSRASDGARYDLRGSTTSSSFHDQGQPDLDYYVTAVAQGGGESDRSNVVRIDERLRLPAPTSITSLSLNGAVHVSWADNAFQSRPTGFRWYRVYSTSYDLDDNLCGTAWALEGTTVAPEFLAGSLTNGVPRCFGVSAESREGFESLWSPLRADTPRPDARNVVMYAFTVDPARSGFRFWQDANADGRATTSELGLVLNGGGNAIDFQVTLDVSNRVFLQPVRAGTTVALYGNAPVADLTSIDVAPVTGFATTAIEAVPGWGYVFRMSGGDGFSRFGALRVTHASRDYLIFDWSFQTDPGNPELSIGAGLHEYQGGITVIQK